KEQAEIKNNILVQPGCVYYAFRPQSQGPVGFFSARPHHVYQRCVGQWWRIIESSDFYTILFFTFITNRRIIVLFG
ncbi:hypothetical protein, partial [Photorhabdus africana]|uniref:hypothetical protein n=1 Tax=Photorhabdus africana TaxID=3097554 RepID=UPI002B40927D